MVNFLKNLAGSFDPNYKPPSLPNKSNTQANPKNLDEVLDQAVTDAKKTNSQSKTIAEKWKKTPSNQEVFRQAAEKMRGSIKENPDKL